MNALSTIFELAIPLSVVCQKCLVRIKVPDALANRNVKCPKCGSSFTAVVPATVQIQQLPPESAVAPQSDFPDDFPGDDEPTSAPLDFSSAENLSSESTSLQSIQASPLPTMDERDSASATVVDYLKFRRMITPVLMKVSFWLGVILNQIISIGAIVVGARFYFMNKEGWPEGHGTIFEAVGAALIIVGVAAFFVIPFIMRIWCEYFILFFQMNETLADIRANTQK